MAALEVAGRVDVDEAEWVIMQYEAVPLKAQALIRSRLFSGGIWAVGGKVFVLPLGLLISAILTRVLSPDDMGTYIFAQSVVLSGIVVAQLGLGPTAVRMIAGPLGTGDMTAVKVNIQNLLLWGLTGALITAVLINLFGSRIGIKPDIVVWVSLWVVVLASQKLMAEILRGFHDIRAAALVGDANVGGLISYGAAAAALLYAWYVYGQIALPAVLRITVIAGVIAVVWALFVLAQKLGSLNLLRGGGRPHFSGRFLFAALPVLVHTLAVLLQNQSGIWMLQLFQPASEVALYGVAARLVALVVVPLSVVNSVISPIIPDLFWRGELGKLERILRALATVSAVPAVMALAVFIFAGPFLLRLLFGEFYVAADRLLTMLTIGAVFNVMAGSSGLTLIMTGHQKTLMGISVATGLLTAVVVYLVAGRFGAIGVATVISVSLLLKNLLMLSFNKRLTGIWTHVTWRFNRQLISDLLN